MYPGAWSWIMFRKIRHRSLSLERSSSHSTLGDLATWLLAYRYDTEGPHCYTTLCKRLEFTTDNGAKSPFELGKSH